MYARQDTTVDAQALLPDYARLDVDVEYFHFGGTYLFDGDAARPFLALTVGLSRFDPQPSDLNAESYASVSIGGGVLLRQRKRIGVRLEGRLFTTFVDSDSDIFCQTSPETNFCAIRVDGTTLTQAEIRAGLIFRF